MPWPKWPGTKGGPQVNPEPTQHGSKLLRAKLSGDLSIPQDGGCFLSLPGLPGDVLTSHKEHSALT